MYLHIVHGFLGPPERVYTYNSISMDSAVFAGHTIASIKETHRCLCSQSHRRLCIHRHAYEYIISVLCMRCELVKAGVQMTTDRVNLVLFAVRLLFPSLPEPSQMVHVFSELVNAEPDGPPVLNRLDDLSW